MRRETRASRAARSPPTCHAAGDRSPPAEPECVMSKGMDRKKETKKKPSKTPQEKRAAKNEKKQVKPFAPT
ncbi:hypothetical protein GCM10008101_20530 [Lysobacter xinjiangensis]|uniref:Uncharacterized protein n=1 Tax=Cognatilysobacter xinjiangensis TaxID=546892 RepID=A0ABQ3C7G8_9GAMM|nr:hypothetical protein [Lysobacter xinjiangensis]GGZ66275.1 hypothetical protein GCM10008101_20530 [Lysobacter xinjiangensis]